MARYIRQATSLSNMLSRQALRSHNFTTAQYTCGIPEPKISMLKVDHKLLSYSAGNTLLTQQRQMSKKSFQVELSPDKVVSDTEILDALKHPDFYVVDVRGHKEITEDGKLSAKRWVNIPYDELESALTLSEIDFKKKYGSEKPDKATNIVFHCKGGGRSTIALNTAHKLGYHKSKHFPAGWNGMKKILNV
uniref:Rhodanese domain-containing protein n=1 Tax=Ciona savignyi TaxID=51511 RepID=H2YKH0_CIOSA